MNENAKSGVPDDLHRTIEELNKFDNTELFPDTAYYKLAVVGAVEKFNRMKRNRDFLGLEVEGLKNKMYRLLKLIYKIPILWPNENIVIDWPELIHNLEDAEGWIDHAVSELDKIAKTEVKDLKALEEYNEGLKFQVEALTKVAADQQYRIQDIMETLAEQVSLINEQKQIINAAQAREDETLKLKVQLDSMSNLCQKYARENQKLKKAKK